MFKKSSQPEFLQKPVHKTIGEAFLPLESNGYRPKVLSSWALNSLMVFLVLSKILAIFLVFFIYPDFASMSADVYSRVIELTNNSRVENNLPALSISDELTKAAQAKAEDMMLRQYFSHDTPEGKKPWQWIDKGKYDYTNAGENLARDFSTAEMVHLALMKSPSHRHNILNEKFNDIGVAVLVGEMNNQMTMVMVEMFGKLRTGAVSSTNSNQNPTKKASEIFSSKISDSATIASNQKLMIAENYPTLSSDESIGHTSKNFSNITALEDGSTVAVKGASFIEESVRVKTITQSQTANSAMKYSSYLLYISLAFIVIILLLNIFINIRVQHFDLIIHSLSVIAVIIILILTKFHFTQQLINNVILG